MRRPATHGATTGAVGNLVASASEKARDVMAALAREQPEKVVAEITKMREMTLPAHHDLKGAEVDPKRLHRILRKTYERQPEDFATLLGLEGVGARTLRALSLVGELVVWRTGQHHRSSTLLICARRQDT